MYTRVGDIESVGRKAMNFADRVADAATRVSGAIKGAAVGAQTAPAHPYLVPALIGITAFLALQFTLGKRSRR